MKYFLIGSLMLASIAQADEAQENQNDAEWRSSYVHLETQQKSLESLISKAVEEQKQLKQQISSLSEMKGEVSSLPSLKTELAHYKQAVNELSQQNKELVSRMHEKEVKELLLKTALDKVEGLVDKVQGEVVSLDQRDVQQKSKYQALNARVDNMTQQLEEMQRKLTAMKSSKK
jgi:chromosome segregation ATPase